MLQAAFERLNIHKRKDNQRFYHARIAEAPGKTHDYKILKGYLIKGRGLMDTGALNDSPNFFSVSAGGKYFGKNVTYL